MKSSKGNVIRFLLSLCLLFGWGGLTAVFFSPVNGFAATFNVTNSTELRNALTTAQNNDEFDVINLAAGIYNTDGTPFIYSTSEPEFSGFILKGAGADSTILDGGNSTQVLIIDTTLSDDPGVGIFIENLTIRNGNSDGFGGGMCVFTATASINIIDSKFINNSARDGGGIDIVTDEGLITIIGNIFDNNRATSLGGGASIEATFRGGVRLKDNTFTHNVASSPLGNAIGGGVEIFTGFVDVDLQDNRFNDNIADSSGGGAAITAILGGNIGLTNNIFEGNLINSSSQDTDGAGSSIRTDSGNIVLTNNIFVGNFAFAAFVALDAVGGGASIGTDSGNITVTNNTFTLNNAFDRGGGLFLDVFDARSAVNIYNNIAFNNTARTGTTIGVGQDIFINDVGSSLKIFNNDFSELFSQCENTSGCTPNITRENNINQNPQFVDAAKGNVRLRVTSPAINKGISSAPALPPIDFEGNPRIDGSAPDIGADEFSDVINFLVSFDIVSPVRRSTDTSGCPSGFVGKLTFTAKLENITDRPIDIVGNRSLSSLVIRVIELTNGNLLQNADRRPGGVGARLTVPKRDGFQDGVLRPNQSVNIPFVICLKNENQFSFLVDVTGIASEPGTTSPLMTAAVETRATQEP